MIKVSEEELYRQLEEARSKTRRCFVPNEKQIAFVKAAREGSPPVSFPKIVELWVGVMGWPELSRKQMADIYYKYKDTVK